jgi:phosphoglycolate phosphatase
MVMKINRIFKAAIFDFDDTLLATFEARCRAFIEASAHFNYQVSETTVRENWGKPLPQFILDVLPGVNVMEFEEYYLEHITKHPSKLLPGAFEILSAFHKRKIIMGIVSASSNQVLRYDLQRTNIYHYFSFIYGANDIKYHKPDPRPLHLIVDNLKKCGIKKEEIIFIGDSVRDYWAAQGNSLQFVAVTTGLDPREVFIRYGLNEHFIANDLLGTAMTIL